MKRGAAHLPFAAAVWLLLACSREDSPSATSPEGPEATEPNPAAALDIYDPEHVVEVSVELDPTDWDLLRSEGRSLFDVFLGNDTDVEYTEFRATAVVDGRRYEGVSVRKKGFLGSLSQVRPSLKLDFGDGAALRRLTLNNNRQDPSHARACLAYGFFERAGLPAPACNLARVSVNGEDLGTYTNVEPIKKPFLERHFSSDAGNLYEGQIVDFVAEDVASFQLKTNELANDRSDLEGVVAALDASDAELAAGLGDVLDVERFRDFWAVETLIGHWDGYDGNRNNYYVYSDPESRRLHFIPWGTDGAFAASNPGDPLNTTQTVFANGRIANRLYGVPGERDRFRARLGDLVEELWDESALVDELERLTAQAPDAWPAATAELRRYLQTHGSEVRAELDEPPWEWLEAPEESSPCAGTIGEVRMEFATVYGDVANLFAPGTSFDVAIDLDGAPFAANAWFGSAGVDAAGTDPSVFVRSVGTAAEGASVFLQLALPRAQFTAGTHELHALESVGVVLMLGGDGGGRFVGFVSEGTVELDDASTEEGAAVSGRLNAQLLQLGCAR